MVAAGEFTGTLAWGPDLLVHPGLSFTESMGFLLTAEKDGTPRWARMVQRGGASLAVDPSGRALVAGVGPGCGEPFARAYDLAGASLWTRTFPGACASYLESAPLPDHGFLIGGTYTGEIAGGTAQGRDGFVLDLSP